jgi:hypothetical protein
MMLPISDLSRQPQCIKIQALLLRRVLMEATGGPGYWLLVKTVRILSLSQLLENPLMISTSEQANYPGPSSLRNSKVLNSAGEHHSMNYPPSHNPAPVNVQTEVDGHIIAECVALFFRWHYPQCMFVDRDKFLLGFLNHSYTSKSSSRSLEFSICALGALLSSEKTIRDLAESFYEAAIRSLESGGLLEPQEASIQTLTLCSFYQTGQGNFSQAWMLSGTVALHIGVTMCKADRFKASRSECAKN